MPAIKTGKGHFLRLALAFFLIFTRLPVCESQETGGTPDFPLITRMDSRDTLFKQYITDVESNRRRLASPIRIPPRQIAEHLTIYQYITRQGDELFYIAARCNIPYSALASLNRLSDPHIMEEGRLLLLPSCPGIFIPANYESELEKLLTAGRLASQESVQLRINVAGTRQTFYFFPGEDFTSTERTFFLNTGFRFPLRTFRITSAYGIRQNPITGDVSMHRGIDLAAPEGTEVYAITDGTVTEIGNDPVYGIYIVITHKDRITSLYGHLQKAETVLNSTVKSGTLIGRVGTTGQSTGPHLHFELRQDGRAVNPSGRLRP